MRIIAILALLACWTATEASSEKTAPVETTANWAVGGSEGLNRLLQNAPAPLLSAEERSPEQVYEVLEDMRVMAAAFSQLIAKTFPDDQNLQNAGVRSYYLGGGCLFLADLPYHVAGGETQSADQPTDKAWNAARRKLGYAPRAPVPLDRSKRLQEAIRSALKLAKNIRHLEANDFIAVAAVGGEASAPSILTGRASFGDLSAVEFASEWTGGSSALADAATLSRVMDTLLRSKLRDRYSDSDIRFYLVSDPSYNGVIVFPVNKKMSSFYLKGFGALFFVDVLYPVGKKGAGSAQPADLWQEALREMQSRRMRQADKGAGSALSADLWQESLKEMQSRRMRQAIAVDYRGFGRSLMNLTEKEAQELLSQTADAVLESLRYSPRIRGMGPNEALIVSIRGSDGSWLVFRSLKRHADAYGAGALDINAFQEKVSVEIDMRPLSWETVMQSPAPPVDALTLTISEDGSMTLDGKAVTMAQLKLRFNSAPAEKKKQLIIRSSPKVGHEQIVEAMDLANRADIQKIGLAIEARKPNVTKGDGK